MSSAGILLRENLLTVSSSHVNFTALTNVDVHTDVWLTCIGFAGARDEPILSTMPTKDFMMVRAKCL
jgi:hypothetical protein